MLGHPVLLMPLAVWPALRQRRAPPDMLALALHAGFGALAVTLAWPRAGTMLALVLLLAGVCWSRLLLGRHRPADLTAGLAAGTLAGIGFAAWA